MFEFATRLFDTTGFVPRSNCGEWDQNPGLRWMHVGGDIFIWLAYLSIPLVLLYFTRRRDLPHPRLFVLFAVFIMACGFGHLLEALMFEHPLYRLAGVWKVFTAIVSWATVFALIPVIPRVMAAVNVSNASPTSGTGDTNLHRLVALPSASRASDYAVAVLCACLALVLRAAVDRVVQTDHIYVLSLMAVVFVSWQSGFWPALLTLFISTAGMIYFFSGHGYTFIVEGFENQLVTGMFFFCGVCCAALGEAQRAARRRAKLALEVAMERKADLEIEIARRREAEDAIRESEERFRSMADSAAVLIWVADLSQGRTYFNRTWLAFTGHTSAHELGEGWAESIHPADREMYMGAYQKALAGRTPFELEYRLRRHDGVYRRVMAHANPRFTPTGAFSGFVGLCLDVTDRLEAEEKVRRSERNLADFFENANVGLHWVGADGVILRANKAELELLGYTQEEYVGRPITDFHADQDVITDILARLKRGERLDNYPARVKRKDGTFRDVLIALSGLWEGGRFIHSRCFTRDVTDLKRATEELAARARLVALRGDMAAALAIGADTRTALQGCTETLVRHINAAFARVWLADSSGEWLELEASAGLYTHIDGPHSRIHFGEFKIGRIANDRMPHLTNDVGNDPNISDPAWAAREGLTSFAGYPLIVDGRVLGVVALFARHDLSGALLGELGPIVETIAQYLARRRAEEAVSASEEKFRQLAESIPQLAWMTDADGSIFWYNQRWYDYTATTLEDMRGWGWQTVHDPAELPRVVEKFKAHIASGAPWEDTFPLRRHDGVMRWHLSLAQPIQDETGRVVRWFGTNTDITERREMEEALRAAADRFRTLTEAVPQMVWTADPKGEFTSFNRRWDTYTGGPMEPGRSGWVDVVHPEEVERMRTQWQLAVAHQADRFTDEFRMKRASDGVYRWMLSVAVPLTDSTGTVVEWVGSLTDIDDQKQQAVNLENTVRERTAALMDEVEERKRAELQVRTVAAELARSNKELEQFAYIASHDLQEPLRKIQAFGDRLTTKFREPLPDAGKDYVDRMLVSAHRMRRLIDDLLSFSRVTSQAKPFSRVALGPLVHEVVSDLSERIEQSGGTVNVGELSEIAADPTQMRRLFQNLIANALKFQRPGVPPVVEVRSEATTIAGPQEAPVPAYRLTVRDNGIGFDEKYLDRIFQVFQRLHGRNEYEGTGVGLAICHKITERHGGSITAQSQVGEGTVFIIVLPAQQTLQPELAPIESDG